MLLAIDTSTAFASVALVREGRLLAELTWDVGQRHSAELFVRLGGLLESAGVAPTMLDSLAVATGPGSFNGVRVGLAAAKSFAFSLGSPLYGHPTLDVIGWQHASGVTPIWALLEAGRGQVYAARYSPAQTAARWAPADGYLVQTPGEVAARVLEEGEPVLFAGEWRAETRATIEEQTGALGRFASPLAVRRASALAALALAREAPDDPLALEPLYLRKPHITRSAKIGLAPPEEPTIAGTQGATGATETLGTRDGQGATHALRH